jgi:hypothetical protein
MSLHPLSFPSTVPGSGSPLAPAGPGGPVPRFPRYYGLLRLPATLPALLRCLRFAVPPLCRLFAPVGGGTPRWAWVRFTWRPSPLSCWRRWLDLPGSWGTPVHVPCSMTPVGPSGQALATFGCCLPIGERRRLPQMDAFEARSHGPCTPCLRFTRSVTLPHARLGSGCWPALPGGACCRPAGLQCEVSGCLGHPSSPPRLGLAHSPSIPGKINTCMWPGQASKPNSMVPTHTGQRSEPGIHGDQRGCWG